MEINIKYVQELYNLKPFHKVDHIDQLGRSALGSFKNFQTQEERFKDYSFEGEYIPFRNGKRITPPHQTVGLMEAFDTQDNSDGLYRVIKFPILISKPEDWVMAGYRNGMFMKTTADCIEYINDLFDADSLRHIRTDSEDQRHDLTGNPPLGAEFSVAGRHMITWRKNKIGNG